jgi:hypothetical protein
MTSVEIKLGYFLLEYLRDRKLNKFNVIGRSTKGEFETWLGRHTPPSEKQTLIWLWDEFKRERLISGTGSRWRKHLMLRSRSPRSVSGNTGEIVGEARFQNHQFVGSPAVDFLPS